MSPSRDIRFFDELGAEDVPLVGGKNASLGEMVRHLADLTQLTLGVDRDSELVAFDDDERDEGVKTMIRLAIDGCRRNGVHSGLCDMAELLVEWGIDSMSLNPDTVVKTTLHVLEVEARFGRGRAVADVPSVGDAR